MVRGPLQFQSEVSSVLVSNKILFHAPNQRSWVSEFQSYPPPSSRGPLVSKSSFLVPVGLSRSFKVFSSRVTISNQIIMG